MVYIDVDKILSTVGKYIIKLLFPAKCLFCGSILDETEEKEKTHLGLCNLCEKGNPVVGWLSGETRLGPALVHVDGVFSGCEYTQAIKSAIVRLKFYDMTQLAGPLSYLMNRELKKYSDLFEVIVPVPLSARRMRERGYNQSQLIADCIGETLGIAVNSQTLVRARHTQKQSLTSGEQRQKNIEGAFKISDDRLRNKKILLVDDVLTTGSTVAECAKVLRVAGVSRIYVAVVAVAL